MAILQIERFDPYEDDGYPTSRCVDGTDVHKCATTGGGAFTHFGSPRKHLVEWRNSKTGRRTTPPDYARDLHGGGYLD